LYLVKKLMCSKTELIARMFLKQAFLKGKKARSVHVGKSNYFAKLGGLKVRKGGGSDKRTPPPTPHISFYKYPSLKK
jgi:hypothetical protein